MSKLINYMIQFSKKILQKARLLAYYIKDYHRFSKYGSFSNNDKTFSKIESKIIYNVHAIEKGLSRSENLRLGFGETALKKLNAAMEAYVSNNYDLEGFAFKQGLSIFSNYQNLHQTKNYDLTRFRNIVNSKFLNISEKNDITGSIEVFYEDKINNGKLPFDQLALNRVSVREFSGESIDLDKVKNAIEISLKSPSVCNRQGWKVYLLKDKLKIENTLVAQRGFKNYPKLPEYLLIVTVSYSTFLSPVERNEAYVDGGLISMSLLYALEFNGLAAVPLNAMMNFKDEKTIREINSIPKDQQLIMFIAVGGFKRKNVVPTSYRKSLEDVLIELN